MKFINLCQILFVFIIFLFVSLLFFFLFPQKIFAGDEDIVINEVYYQGDNQLEWIELYNKGISSIPLDGWVIQDNTSSDPLPSSTIPAGGFAVIITSNSTVSGISSSAVIIQLSGLTIGNGLANSGDKVILKNSSGLEIDSMSYGSNTTVFTLLGVDVGHSYERIPAGTDTNSANDFIDQSSSTPGAGVSSTPTPSPTSTPTLAPTKITSTKSPTKTASTPTKTVSSPTPTQKILSSIPSQGKILSVARSTKINIPTSVLGQSTKSAAATPSAGATSSNKEVKTLGSNQNNIFKILIGVGGLFIIACAILLFRHYKNKKIDNE